MNKPLLLGIGALVTVLIISEKKVSRGQDLKPSSKTKPGDWFPVRLTEYHPDAPASARKREGGPKDRIGQPVRTVEDFRAKRSEYVSVSADLFLQGRDVPYGARVYLDGWPDLVFRIVDTGENFMGTTKQIRQAGHEPLDIATLWDGPHREFNGKLTRARVDYSDTLSKRVQMVS
jgi:hypothetical protein